MGRHARGALRPGRTVAGLAVGALAVGVVGVGLWLLAGWQSDPSTSDPTESAVVVSSLACADGAGGTVVDVFDAISASGGGQVRADLEACGYQEGQQLQVQFVPGDRTQVVLAGNESASDVVTGDRLPVGLVIVGLLLLGAALAVWIDARRAIGRSPGGARRDTQLRGLSRAGPGERSGSRHHRSDEVEDEPDRLAAEEAIVPDDAIDADAVIDSDQVFVGGQVLNEGQVFQGHEFDGGQVTNADSWPAQQLQLADFFAPARPDPGNTLVLPAAAPRPGRHARPDVPRILDAASEPSIAGPADPAIDAPPDPGDNGKLTGIRVIALAPTDDPDRAVAAPETVDADRSDELSPSLSTVDLTFPFSSGLAACLHDELFTHRTRSS